MPGRARQLIRRRSIPPGHYDIRLASKLSGLSSAMVDYLCRTEIFVPTGRPKPGRGRSRLYTFGDLVVLRGLRALLASGISVARLKKALATLREMHTEITPKTVPAKYLVANGRQVFFWDEKRRLEDLTAGGQMAFAFVLEVARLRDEVLTQERLDLSGAKRR